MRSGCVVGLASALALVAGAASAADPSSDVPDAATLAHDRQIVDETFAASQTRGFDVVRDRMPDLQAVLSHAPSPFSQFEERGAVVYLREASTEGCLLDTALITASKSPVAKKEVACIGNPYPGAALLIGSYLDDIGRPAEGLAILDRGLTFEPHYPALVGERGAALNMLHRHAEALADFQSGLAGPAPLDNWQKGFLLRGEGFALTELKRYDEATAAYQESLKVDPDHGHAANELEYIARMKAGAAPTAVKFNAAIPAATPPK